MALIEVLVADKNPRLEYSVELVFNIMGYPYRIVRSKEKLTCPVIIEFNRLLKQKSSKKDEIRIDVNPNWKVKGKNSSKKGYAFCNVFSEVFDIIYKNKIVLDNEVAHISVEEKIREFEKFIRAVFKKENIPLVRKCNWPFNRAFGACLTHDVDVIYKYNVVGTLVQSKKAVSNLLKGRLGNSAKIAKEFTKTRLGSKDPYFNFQDITSLENEYRYKSTFFFVGKRRMKLDPYYSINDKQTINAARCILDDGFEIGMHASYTSYNDEKKISEEKNILEKTFCTKIISNRQHFLNNVYPDTFRFLSSAGVCADSTIGLKKGIGAAKGISMPYGIFDSENEEKLKILEIPMMVMDGSYFNMKSKDKENLLFSFLDEIKKNNALATINFHQGFTNKEEFVGWEMLYRQILDYLKKNDAFVGTMQDIYDWTKSRNSLEITCNECSKAKVIYSIAAIQDIKNIVIEIDPDWKIYISGSKTKHRMVGKNFIEFDSLQKEECVKIELRK